MRSFLTIFILTFFSFSLNVKAEDLNETIICSYKGTSAGNVSIDANISYVIINNETKFRFTSSGVANIDFANNPLWTDKDFGLTIENLKEATTLGGYKWSAGLLGFIPTEHIYISPKAAERLLNLKCPDYASQRPTDIMDLQHICFENANEGYCNQYDTFWRLNLEDTASDSNDDSATDDSSGSDTDFTIPGYTPDTEEDKITVPPTDNICEGIFYKNGQKTDFAKLLQGLLNVIKYAAPILVLAFSVIDFLKAIINQNKDELTKATKNSAVRLILAIILFFIPTLINFILMLLFGITDPTCSLM